MIIIYTFRGHFKAEISKTKLHVTDEISKTKLHSVAENRVKTSDQ